MNDTRAERAALSRRGFIIGAGTLAATGLVLPGRARATDAGRQLSVGASTARLAPDRPEMEVLAYGGTLPGPTFRVRQGEPFKATLVNGLNEPTTIHWHGIRVPIGMDGVPWISQPPVAQGESFDYAFTPPDAGTFWYHPHLNSGEQISRGLAAAIIVDEPEPPPVDRELTWLVSDWRIDPSGQIATGFDSMMEAMMSGRVGNVVTINGTIPSDETVRAGERVRLRLLNAAVGRILALRFEGHRPVVVAIDGQPCDPHEPTDGRILLGPAMRADIMLDCIGEPGARYAIVDDFYPGLAYTLTTLSYAAGDAGSRPASPELIRLQANPLPEPDLDKATPLRVELQGGMMGAGPLAGLGGLGGDASPGMNHSAAWAINGMSMTGDGSMGMDPIATFQAGQSVTLTLVNSTAWWHPMHIHGHSARMLTRNGVPIPNRQWADTVLLAPRDVVECAFVAGLPGDWMLHCHITGHQMTGLMTIFRVV